MFTETLQGRKLTPKQDIMPKCKLKGQLCGKASYPEAPDNGECCLGSKLRCAYHPFEEGGNGTCMTDKEWNEKDWSLQRKGKIGGLIGLLFCYILTY